MILIFQFMLINKLTILTADTILLFVTSLPSEFSISAKLDYPALKGRSTNSDRHVVWLYLTTNDIQKLCHIGLTDTMKEICRGRLVPKN